MQVADSARIDRAAVGRDACARMHLSSVERGRNASKAETIVRFKELASLLPPTRYTGSFYRAPACLQELVR